MRRASVLVVLAAAGCEGILGIPSEGKVGCPEPCTLTVSGKAVRAESTASPALALPNVTIRLTSVTPAPKATSGNNGSYSFTGLAPDTALQFDLSIPQTDPDPQGLLDTRFVAGSATGDTALDLPVVQYRWLAKVAFQCGLFATEDAAIFEAGTTNVNSYFVSRSTVIGEVLNSDGSPAALDRGDISVVLGGFINFHKNPSDTLNPPSATVCFLEPDIANGEYKGVNEDHSTSGRFVMFRVRADVGTGAGAAEIRIPGYPVGDVTLASATIGYVRIKLGEGGEPLPQRQRTFERDVYHFFTDKLCNQTCHKPGGSGYMTAPMRLGTDGKTYPADYSGTVEQVYDVLTKPFDTDCQLGGDKAARVCKAKPEASLLYLFPAGMPSGTNTHPGIALQPDDPMLANVLQWIKDGAALR